MAMFDDRIGRSSPMTGRVGGMMGNKMFDDFITNILPLIESTRNSRALREAQLEESFRPKAPPMQRGALPNIAQQIRQPQPMQEPEKPMNVSFGLSPYQQAQIDLRNRSIDAQGDRAKDTNALRERGLDETERRGRVTTDVAQQRANVYEWKSKNPNAKIIATPGGNLIAVDPITKRSVEVKGADGNPVSSNTLSPEEVIELNQTNALERIGATADEGRKTMDMRFEKQGEQNEINAAQRMKEIEQRNTNEQNLIPLRESSKTAKPVAETKQRVLNKVNEFKAREPDLGKWVTLDEDGNIEVAAVTRPGDYWGTTAGPTAIERQKIVDALYGGTTTPKEEDTEKPPTGAKPGGKWIQTKFGRVYQES